MIPSILRALRTEKNMTQADVANALEIDRSTYTKYESGKSKPDSIMLQKIANLFNVSTDYLLGRTNERQNYNINNNDDDWPPEAKVLFRDVKKLTPEQLELVTKLVKQFINED